MPRQSSDYFDVDQAARQPDAAQRVAQYFGLTEEELHLAGEELRTRCFLQCGKEHPTGNRALAIQVSHAAKIWKCHHYGCGKQGNLVSLTSLAMGLSARPRGEEFKQVRDLLRQILTGEAQPQSAHKDTNNDAAPPCPSNQERVPQINIPLSEHSNERVRSVADLYKKLTLDVSQMPPHASRYVRERPFLAPAIGDKYQLGYLSKSTGSDKSGGTMRGKFVVAIHNREGQIVGYAGRDTDWERKHDLWIRNNREGKEPAKWTFPSNFHRGIEVYNQHRLTPEFMGDKPRKIGLLVVEGVNDVINLEETLDLPAVAILSNHATDEQIARIAELARAVTNGVVTLLYDCDEEGDSGMDRDTVKFAKHCRVERAWARDMYVGRFLGMQPENLNATNSDILMLHR